MSNYCVYHIARANDPIYKGYIGITNNFELRKRQHLYEAFADRHKNVHLMRAFKAYKDIIFTKLHENMTLEDALSCEAFYRPVPAMGWNIKAGGLDGTIMSEESKEKISKKHIGKTVSEETRNKLRSANLGKKQSIDSIKKRAETLSKLFKGRPKTTPNEIASLVEGRKGLGNPHAKPVNIYDATTNELIAEYVSIPEWCRQHPEYKEKQLRRTASPNEPLKIYNNIYAVYIPKKE